jgi:hypothetical protein
MSADHLSPDVLAGARVAFEPIVRAKAGGDEADQLLDLLVDQLVPARLAHLGSLEERLRPAAVELHLNDIVDELLRWPEHEWKTRITAGVLMSRLAPPSLRALGLAKTVAHDAGRRADLRDDATALRAEIERVADDAAAAGEEVADALAMEISEARRDCDFVLRPAPVTSLRLAHLIGGADDA